MPGITRGMKPANRTRTKLRPLELIRPDFDWELRTEPNWFYIVYWRLNMDHQTKPVTDALLHSLSTIQAAKTRLHLLNAGSSTPTVLVSQIRLCDVLLREILAIRSSLASRMRCRSMIRRRPVVARRIRSTRHGTVPQGNSAIRSRYTR